MLLDFFRPISRNISISGHFDGRKFFNPYVKEKLQTFRLLKWLIKRKKANWPKWVKNRTLAELPVSIKDSQIAITFISHASFLIQTPTLNILIDPVYSKHVGLFSFIGPKRVRLPGVPFSKLPFIDLVLISHNHYDHLDLPTLKKIKRQNHNALFITGLGNEKLLNSNGIKNVIELDWWESEIVKDEKIIFTPAQHFTSRTPFDRGKTLWGGFVIETGGKKIYFAGDSGYGPHFKEIHSRVGALNLALLPIGAYKPRWLMKPMHMNPEEAIFAHLDLKAKLSIPMHFGMFCLSDESCEQPLIDLEKAMKKHKVSKIKILDFGQTHIMN